MKILNILIFTIKLLNLLAFVTSLLCILVSVADDDWTEAFAWGIVCLYNFKDLMNNEQPKNN